jgi:hypothetical protein
VSQSIEEWRQFTKYQEKEIFPYLKEYYNEDKKMYWTLGPVSGASRQI